MTNEPSGLPELYDVENALRELARFRRRRDEATIVTAGMADDLAANITRHFGPEALETVGLGLVIAGASAGAVARMGSDSIAAVVVNLITMAGQRIVLDARAADAKEDDDRG